MRAIVETHEFFADNDILIGWDPFRKGWAMAVYYREDDVCYVEGVKRLTEK